MCRPPEPDRRATGKSNAIKKLVEITTAIVECRLSSNSLLSKKPHEK